MIRNKRKHPRLDFKSEVFISAVEPQLKKEIEYYGIIRRVEAEENPDIKLSEAEHLFGIEFVSVISEEELSMIVNRQA